MARKSSSSTLDDNNNVLRMASTNMCVRVAKPEDLKAMLALSRRLYGGVDYIRSLFYVFLQDPRCYCYVAEVEGQVVCFVGKRIMEDDKTVYSFGSRSALGYEGLGAMTAISSEIMKKITEDYPGITKTQNIAIDSPRFQKSLLTKPGSQITLEWVYHMFYTDAAKVKSAVEKSCSAVKSEETTTLVSYSKILKLIPDIEELLHSLGVSYLRTGQIIPGFPQSLSSDCIRQCFMNNDIILTNNTETNTIQAVSVFCSFVNNSGGPVSVLLFYGRDIRHFKQHIEILLKHVLSLVDPRVNETMGFIIQFPVDLDEGAVEQYLSGRLGSRLQINGGMTRVYLVTRSLL